MGRFGPPWGGGWGLGLGLGWASRTTSRCRKERKRSWGGREVYWTLPEAASRDYAAKLHKEALEAAAEGSVHA